MIDAERMVWCAAFGAAVVKTLTWHGVGRSDEEAIPVAKHLAWRAVRALGGPSAHLSADSMMIAAIAEHGLARAEENK